MFFSHSWCRQQERSEWAKRLIGHTVLVMVVI
jgi:hypothetical protein